VFDKKQKNKTKKITKGEVLINDGSGRGRVIEI